MALFNNTYFYFYSDNNKLKCTNDIHTKLKVETLLRVKAGVVCGLNDGINRCTSHFL